MSEKRVGVQAMVRRAARERAVQFLFGLEFVQPADWRNALQVFWETASSRGTVRAYAESLIDGVLTHRVELDEAIKGVVSNWTPERMGHVERNILRIALYEMRHCDDVPDTVAINEALEVAKRFGAEDAPRFINGVLDQLKGA